MKIQVDTLEKNESVAISLIRERNSSNSDFYQYSENITKVIFQNKMEPIEAELSWDISKYQDKNCMAYLVLNEEETEPTYIFKETTKYIWIVGYRYLRALSTC